MNSASDMPNPGHTQAPDNPARRLRSDGRKSKERILAAAKEVAEERGYDGATIAEICRRADLPASSVYKDQLLVKVIEESYRAWNEAWDIGDSQNVIMQMPVIAEQILDALEHHSLFIRLGLPLAIQKRKDNPRPRQMYVRNRDRIAKRLAAVGRRHFPQIPEARRDLIIGNMISGVEGIFVAEFMREGVDADSGATAPHAPLTLRDQLELHAEMVIAMILREAERY